jgi:hypothetical protein
MERLNKATDSSMKSASVPVIKFEPSTSHFTTALSCTVLMLKKRIEGAYQGEN